MEKIINPDIPGITARDVLLKESEGHWYLKIDRKSRIVMADGKRIAAKIGLIREHGPHLTLSLLTTAPVCSKTRQFLNDHEIAIKEIRPA